ncbi:hypothetical protein HPS57_11760 [Prevotella sp. PINT]|jgi:hypothetical protein|uniref:hypothetical protein n=1 Tax=Palleniella intestinalis TaxID=2736291 RepID=UPI001554AF2A|nr:hypothetical protein [Palleniella intestinalis]NPD82641.1 hypothetical protein [Palleniella intestinalis]
MGSTTSLQLIASKALPALSGANVIYNAAKNIFLAGAYTSAAGNTYYKAIRFSDRLVVYYDIGEGYCHNFLNGIHLYAWDGQRAKLIAKKSWGGCCNYRYFNEQTAKEESILMLKAFLEGQAKLAGYSVSCQQLLDFSRSMINDTQRKLLA